MCKSPIYHPTYKIFVPCKKCYECQAAARAAWSFRCIQESINRPYSVFITLTYDDEHLPYNDYAMSNKTYYKKKYNIREFSLLSKEDASIFLKNCQDIYRQLYGYLIKVKYRNKSTGQLKERSIIKSSLLRYKLTAEYGDIDQRPHYHLILWFPPDYTYFNIDNISKVLQCIWEKGFVDVQDTSFANINYVAKHQVKECQGNLFQQRFAPIFQKVSRYNGGIGTDYLNKIQSYKVNRNGKYSCILPNGVRLSLPQFYRKKLFTDNISDYDMQRLSYSTRQRNYSLFKNYCRENGFHKVYNIICKPNFFCSDLTNWSIDVKKIWYLFLKSQYQIDVKKRYKIVHRKFERRFISARYRNDEKMYNCLKKYLFN